MGNYFSKSEQEEFLARVAREEAEIRRKRTPEEQRRIELEVLKSTYDVIEANYSAQRRAQDEIENVRWVG